MKTIKEINFQDKKLIVRVDFDVPLTQRATILDDLKIRASLPTISYLLKQRPAKIILVGHLDRPKGKIIEKLKLLRVAERLKKLLGLKEKIEKIILDKFSAYQLTNNLILLENIRFYPQEEENDLSFTKKLTSLGDIFINDAFADSHRAHASIKGVSNILPPVAGLLLDREIKNLSKLLNRPNYPFMVIIGGTKIEDKKPAVLNLAKIADKVLVGGRTAIEAEQDPEIIQNSKVVLPVDYQIDEENEKRDIGNKTIELFKQELKEAKTIFWNGNMGMSEVKPFEQGTRTIAEILAKATGKGAKTIVAGGDTTGFVRKAGLANQMTYLSTGGGATLEFLAGKKLPGLESLL